MRTNSTDYQLRRHLYDLMMTGYQTASDEADQLYIVLTHAYLSDERVKPVDRFLRRFFALAPNHPTYSRVRHATAIRLHVASTTWVKLTMSTLDRVAEIEEGLERNYDQLRSVFT